VIVEQIRKGIRIALATDGKTMREICKKTEMPESTIYRFMGGNNDISVVRLDRFLREGFNRNLMDVLELGK